MNEMQMDYFPIGNVVDKTSKDILKIFEKHLKEISSIASYYAKKKIDNSATILLRSFCSI